MLSNPRTRTRPREQSRRPTASGAPCPTPRRSRPVSAPPGGFPTAALPTQPASKAPVPSAPASQRRPPVGLHARLEPLTPPVARRDREEVGRRTQCRHCQCADHAGVYQPFHLQLEEPRRKAVAGRINGRLPRAVPRPIVAVLALPAVSRHRLLPARG